MNMRRLVRLPFLLLALLLVAAGPSLARADDAPPKLARHVTDLTGTLSPQQVDQLDNQLIALEKSKGAQLVVLMVGSTQPQDIESYSLAVAEANKVGRKGPDDGVLLLIAKNDRRVRIEVGYGLEGAIPDAAANRIIREYLAPKFRTNDYYGGISDAVGALTSLINDEALPPPVEAAHRERSGLGFQEMLFIGIFAGLMLRGVLGRARIWLRTPVGAALTGGLLWLLAATAGAAVLGAIVGGVMMLLPAGAGRSIGGGGWGGFGGWGGGGGWGRGGGGGFGGGGFSGGGGSFGGGGSSGSW